MNNPYEITLYHTGSRPEDDPPWYCWEAGISTPQSASARAFDGNPSPVDHTFAQAFARSASGSDEFFMHGEDNRWIVDNREGVMAGHTHSKGENLVQGKKAKMIPVAISDSSEATGVDATSITADPEDPGYQDKYWIMAPSGDDPNGNECKNDMLFQIPLVPPAQMAISYPEGSPPPATPAPTTVTLGTADAACSWHGESVTTTEAPEATYKVGDDEIEVALPIHVKTMKNRKLKISVFPVRKSASSPAIAMPNKAALTAKLRRVFGYQLNAWAVEPDYKPEQVFDYDPDDNGILNWPSETHNQLLAQCVDAQADLIVTLIGDVAYVVGDEVAAGSSVPNTKPVVVTTSRPYDLSILSNLIPIPEADVVDTTMHEIGHRILGDGHPDQGGGKAPLEGTDRRRRLMASGGHRGYNAYLIVKTEWDAAEGWFKLNVD